MAEIAALETGIEKAAGIGTGKCDARGAGTLGRAARREAIGGGQISADTALTLPEIRLKLITQI